MFLSKLILAIFLRRRMFILVYDKLRKFLIVRQIKDQIPMESLSISIKIGLQLCFGLFRGSIWSYVVSI